MQNLEEPTCHDYSSTLHVGPLDAPYNFSVAMSNTSFNLSWGAPFSLNVTNNTEIFNYTLCINITIYGCKTIPSDPDCTFPRTCTSSVDFTDPSLNKTIMDYGDPILFKIAAINGAGMGNTTEYIYRINDTGKRILYIYINSKQYNNYTTLRVSWTCSTEHLYALHMHRNVWAKVLKT